jgi:hypothetical protein
MSNYGIGLKAKDRCSPVKHDINAYPNAAAAASRSLFVRIIAWLVRL